jgi:hypothetical protein
MGMVSYLLTSFECDLYPSRASPSCSSFGSRHALQGCRRTYCVPCPNVHRNFGRRPRALLHPPCSVLGFLLHCRMSSTILGPIPKKLSSVVSSKSDPMSLCPPLSEIHEAMWLLVQREVPFIELKPDRHFSLNAKQFVESSWQWCSVLWTLHTMSTLCWMHPTWNTWPHDPNWNAPLGPKGSKHTWHQQPDSIHLAISPGWTNSFSLSIK